MTAPDHSLPFEIYADAANNGCGALLAQKQSGRLCLIAFASKRMTSSEQRMNTTHKELLSLVWAIQTFDDITKHCFINFYIDHKPLLTLSQKLQDPNPIVTRYLYRLSLTPHNISHVRGEDNQVADCLSRATETAKQYDSTCPSDLVSHLEDQINDIQKTNMLTKTVSSNISPLQECANVINDLPSQSVIIGGRTLRSVPQRRAMKHNNQYHSPNTSSSIATPGIPTPISTNISPPTSIIPSTSTTPSTVQQVQDDHLDSAMPSDVTQSSQSQTELKLSLQSIKEGQAKDSYLKHLIQYLLTQTEPLDRNIYSKILRDHADFVIDEGILKFIYKPRHHKDFAREWELHLVVPETLVPTAL